MHGMLTYHFYHDCYYPRGGASEIAFNFIPGILRPGGNVLVRAPVSSILFEGKRAVGRFVCTLIDELQFCLPICIICNAIYEFSTNKKQIMSPSTWQIP